MEKRKKKCLNYDAAWLTKSIFEYDVKLKVEKKMWKNIHGMAKFAFSIY